MLKFNFIQKFKRFFFPFYKNSDLKFVFKKLQQNTKSQTQNAMFVGGCVRKYLSNESIDDIDIATSLTTDEIKERLKETKFNIIDSGIKHGTVTLVSKNFQLEITTLRKDVKTDGRHAEIKYTDNWTEDSERRDFTINAIYLGIDGKIFDPQLGIEDLKNKNIKFIGDPQKRIEEDYLRIIRFIRFSLEYESKVEQSTAKAIKLNLDGIKKISKERILSELFKILRTKNFIKLNHNDDLKTIFKLIFPEFKNLEWLNRIETISNQYTLEKETLLALLLVDETNNHEYFSHKYNVSNELKENLNLIAKNFANMLKDKKFLKKNLTKNAYFFGKEHLKMLNTFYYCGNKQIKSKEYLDTLKKIEKLSIPKFLFDGNYLKEHGMKEGILIGKTLKIIENEWINNEFKISNKRVLEIIKKNN